jgi:hypothetical protein
LCNTTATKTTSGGDDDDTPIGLFPLVKTVITIHARKAYRREEVSSNHS